MNDDYLLELLAWASSVSSLTVCAPRGAPSIEREDVLGAIGGCRATITLADGSKVQDVSDAGPELLQIEAGVKTRTADIVPALARATVGFMLSQGWTPNAAACHEAAAYVLYAWMRPGQRIERPNRIEDAARRAKIRDSSRERHAPGMTQHIEAAEQAMQAMRGDAMRRFGQQVASARSREWTRTPEARRPGHGVDRKVQIDSNT